jgi:hypothetical protein
MTRARLAARIAVALVLGIALFGWIDLTATWKLGGDTTSYDLAYGGLTGLMLPAAFLAGAPSVALAGGTGYAVAGIGGGQLRYVLLGAVVAAAAVLLLGIPRPGFAPKAPLVALALVATPAFVWVAVHASDRERAHITDEAHAGFHAWAGVAAFAVAAFAVSWLAAAGADRRVAAWSVGTSVAYYGIGCVIYPNAAASVGRVLGTLAVVWGTGMIAAAEAGRRAPRSV